MLTQVSNPLWVVEPLELLELVLHLVEDLFDSLLAVFSDLPPVVFLLLVLVVRDKASSLLLRIKDIIHLLIKILNFLSILHDVRCVIEFLPKYLSEVFSLCTEFLSLFAFEKDLL